LLGDGDGHRQRFRPAALLRPRFAELGIAVIVIIISAATLA